MPFSAGPRACIGTIFAMQAMKISISMILQRFRVQVVPGAKVERVVRVTMRPRYGIPIKIFAQDRKFTRSDVRGNMCELVDMK
jgi:cytochrome P450